MNISTAHRYQLATLLCALAVLLAPQNTVHHHAFAESEVYEIPWWTVDGGGGSSSDADGAFTLRGTAGQADACQPLTGGNYTLAGGFWVGPLLSWQVYLPVVIR